MKKIIVIIIMVLSLTGCTQNIQDSSVDQSSQNTQNSQETEFNKNINVSSKPFLIGTAGFTPFTKENISTDIINEFWETTDLISDLYGVHVAWDDSRLVDDSINNLDAPLVVVLGLQSPQDWTNNRENFIDRAVQILESDKVKYLAIGNEINTLNEEYPDQFSNFLDAYKYIYNELKEQFPDKIIFTVFQYETLIGEGYITGKSESLGPSLFILDELKNHTDIIGLTSYPWLDFADPNDIPLDYYSDIREYTNKPIGLTEVGWLSREELPDKFQPLTQQEFNGSQEEQIEYFNRLIEIGENENISFANWAFLDDIRDWRNGQSVEDANFMFESIGLRYYNSNPKDIYYYWGTLQNLPLSE